MKLFLVKNHRGHGNVACGGEIIILGTGARASYPAEVQMFVCMSMSVYLRFFTWMCAFGSARVNATSYISFLYTCILTNDQTRRLLQKSPKTQVPKISLSECINSRQPPALLPLRHRLLPRTIRRYIHPHGPRHSSACTQYIKGRDFCSN